MSAWTLGPRGTNATKAAAVMQTDWWMTQCVPCCWRGVGFGNVLCGDAPFLHKCRGLAVCLRWRSPTPQLNWGQRKLGAVMRIGRIQRAPET